MTEYPKYSIKSIYDMGNPYELCDEECDDTTLACKILNLFQPDNGEKDISRWAESTELRDQTAAKKAKEAYQEAAQELAKLFSRSGGYRERLKEAINLDLNLFDNNILRNKRENAKILYFLYMLEKKFFPKTNILALLSKPSMENIDNSLIGMKTYNGDIISFIMNSLEKEISPYIKTELQKIIQTIAFAWDELLDEASSIADYMAAVGYHFDEKSSLFILPITSENFTKKSKFNYPALKYRDCFSD